MQENDNSSNNDNNNNNHQQPGTRRDVKWFMFSFGLYIGNKQIKQEMGQLWSHMPCATERNPLWNLS